MLNTIQYNPIANKPMVGSLKVLRFLNVSIPITPKTPKVCFLIRCSQPTLSVKRSTTAQNELSFTASYLVQNCRFLPETALSLSRRVSLKNTENPDSVLAFLRDYGFSNTQIRYILQHIPQILLDGEPVSLQDNLEFLQSKGMTVPELIEMVTAYPIFLTRSLEQHIIPCFDALKSLLHSEKRVVSWIKSKPCFIYQSNLKANIQVLLDIGVTHLNVRKLFLLRPFLLLKRCSSFRKLAEEVKDLGFNPSHSYFIVAFIAMYLLDRAKWDRKVEIFKKWGWSEDDFVAAFRRQPRMMMLSETKIMSTMDFLVNQLGCDSSLVAKRPVILQMDLEETLIPRAPILRYLFSKGLMRKHANLITSLTVTEKLFTERYVKRFKEDAPPHLVELYRGKSKYLQ